MVDDLEGEWMMIWRRSGGLYGGEWWMISGGGLVLSGRVIGG